MSLKKITTNITHKVPAWEFCNLQSEKLGMPSKEKCRFCIKEKTHHRCALYNTVLNTENGTFVVKTVDCARATAGFKSIVKDVEPEPVAPAEPVVEPKLLMKVTLQEYIKTRKKLLAQGYPEAIAEKVAQEFVLGGK